MPLTTDRHWYALSLKGRTDDIRKIMQAASLQRTADGMASVDYFMPTIVVESRSRGRVVLRNKKLLGRYIFINDSAKNIDALRARYLPNLNWLYNEDGRQCAPVPDDEMQMFRTIARQYGATLPCYPIGDVDLDEGDYVEIVGGPFDGVRGRLRTQQGRDGGNVVLAVGNLFVVTTKTIEPQYIRILTFGHGNRHPYRQFEAHLPRVLDALDAHHRRQPLSEHLRAALDVFTRRYADLQPATVNQAGWHAALLLASHTALGNASQAAQALVRCQELLPRLTAEQQRALHLALMWATTADPTLLPPLQAIIDSWQPIDESERKKRAIADIVTRFSSVGPCPADLSSSDTPS